MIRKIRKKDGKNVMREKERIGTIVKNHNQKMQGKQGRQKRRIKIESKKKG